MTKPSTVWSGRSVVKTLKSTLGIPFTIALRSALLRRADVDALSPKWIRCVTCAACSRFNVINIGLNRRYNLKKKSLFISLMERLGVTRSEHIIIISCCPFQYHIIWCTPSGHNIIIIIQKYMFACTY